MAAPESLTLAIVDDDDDVRLPGLSGLELSERLRGRKARTPVVLITGNGDRLARDIGTGVDTPLLTKPFDADVLTDAIASAMSMAAVERERHAH
jgi:FixJ family two-component response regulator